MSLVTAKEAARLLGVKTSTIYAYVSRGLLDSIDVPDGKSGKYYRKAEVEKLRRRSNARSGHGPAAASALEWGPPVLETSISEICYAGPKYRGKKAVQMCREDWTYPQVAEWLWQCDDPKKVEWETATDDPRKLPEPPLRHFFDRLHAWQVSQLQKARSSGTPRQDTADLVVELAGAPVRPEEATFPVANSLQTGLSNGDENIDAHGDMIRRALILLAEHGLNASTFSVRTAASTNAPLCAGLTAGLSTFAGPRHGLAPVRIRKLLDQYRSGESLDALVDRHPELVEWFDHPLYPEGKDPRAEHLFERLKQSDLMSKTTQQFLDQVRQHLGSPSVDIALATVARELGLRRGASAYLFAVSRLAGWTAHFLEQGKQGFLIRPRSE